MAEVFHCYGCEAIDFANEDPGAKHRGSYISLIPFTDEDDHVDDEEVIDEY